MENVASEKLFPSQPILMVDDEKSWLDSLCFALEFRGGINNYILCPDSRKAMEILTTTSVSLVLLDLNMPYISGEELLPLIKAHDPELPIIVLSGLQPNLNASKQPFAHLGKTADLQDIIDTVKKALDNTSGSE